MLKRTICLYGACLAGVMVAAAAAPALADEDIQEGKVYRLVLTNDKEVVGTVTEVEDAYKVQVASGIMQTIKKSQVRSLIALEDEQPDAGEASLRRRALDITDAEIKEILGDESVEDLYIWEYVQQVDLMEPLELNQESLEEMKLFAGRQAKWFDTDHFVCVYTSEPKGARQLVSRLETVYKWNATFARMFEIPVRRPEHKLEIFYFGTFDEFVTYATLCGWMAEGALGYYMRTNNRCAFFDTSTYPRVAQLLEAVKDPSVPFERRRKLQNEAERWANYVNLEVVQHEATHAIHFNIGVFPKEARIGTWMVEGLCVQFEVPPTQEGGSFGALNYSRLDSFHKMYMTGEPGEERVAVPWEFVKNLILAPSSGFHDYVMGWALNYYLRKEYGEWMRHLASLEDDWTVEIDTTTRLADFENIFGKVDEAWVQKFYDWIAAIPMKKSAIVEFPDGAP
jgi:hypothetical protein